MRLQIKEKIEKIEELEKILEAMKAQKEKAEKAERDIRVKLQDESTLMGMAIIGGSIGAWLGMKIWHHKTLHKKFKYGVPLILVAQTALCCYLLKLF